MSELDVSISGFVVGDNLTIRRTITGLEGSALALAWFTLKTYPAQDQEDAALQKRITVDNVPGVGRIEAAGGGGDDGVLRFDLTAAETAALKDRSYVYDIQVKLADETVYTLEVGTFQLTADVTQTIT